MSFISDFFCFLSVFTCVYMSLVLSVKWSDISESHSTDTEAASRNVGLQNFEHCKDGQNSPTS